jgi:hypothetical protein
MAKWSRRSRSGRPDIEVMIAGLREITPPTQRVIRMIELLEQIRDRGVAG